MESKWLVGGASALGGMLFSVGMSFVPDVFWMHDNRQALQMLMANQPLVQRDISDLRNGLAENTVALKEVAVEIQKLTNSNSRKPQRLILEKPRK